MDRDRDAAGAVPGMSLVTAAVSLCAAGAVSPCVTGASSPCVAGAASRVVGAANIVCSNAPAV